MSTCCSFNCMKFSECKRASINNEGIHTSQDTANHSYVITDSNGLYKEEYWCGEKGNYKLFEPVNKKAP